MRYCLLILFYFVSAAIVPSGAQAQRSHDRNDWKDLSVQPVDSAEAERTRIWLAQEQDNVCRMIVLIYDGRGRLVRNFLNLPLTPGYYNLYWDKKDDSGRLVEPGEYYFKTNPCGGDRRGTVTAFYVRGENTSSLSLDRFTTERTIVFEIEQDTALVTLEVLDRRNDAIVTLLDTVALAPGTYEEVFEPTRAQWRPLYTVRLTVDEYVHVQQGKLRR
ncbi:MAG: hypothetical protein KKA42_02285 [candidate division Zixibacteria bacterium]|nr:hypothetical protein [candidate division Zixibacteria bacterium]